MFRTGGAHERGKGMHEALLTKRKSSKPWRALDGEKPKKNSYCSSMADGKDIAEIQNLLNSVMVYMDTGNSAEFSKCFVENGTLRIVLANSLSSGREAIAKVCDSLHNKFCKAPTYCKHWEGNVSLTAGVNGSIENVSYWKSVSGGEILSTGIHRDVLQRNPGSGKWEIQTRIIEHTWTKAGGHVP